MNTKKVDYQAFFEPNEQGGYNVSFPALPGCVTFGTNLEHAQIMAKEALSLWLEELTSQHKPLPRQNNYILSNISALIPSVQ